VSQYLLSQRTKLVISLSAVVCFLMLIFLRSSLSSVDNSANSWATTVQNGPFTEVAVVISVVFDTTILLLFSLVAAALLFHKNFKKQSLLLLLSMGGDALLVSISKMLVYSPRPPNELIVETGYSFPSGHVTGGVVFFGLLTYFGWQIWNSSNTKTGLIMFCLTIISIISFDRIYLNVHWFSDVLGGYLLGTFWLTFSIVIFKYLESRKNQVFTRVKQKLKTSNPKD
jgi:undecaprenyl-diphosphatase